MLFLLDVNVGKRLASWLTELGHDVVQVSERNPRMTDNDILSWAVSEQRIIVTTDSGFEEMIWRQGRTHCGVLRMENPSRSQRRSFLRDVLDRHGQDLAGLWL